MMNGKFGNVENVNIHIDTHTLIPSRMYVISGELLKRPGMSQGLMMSSITLMLLTHTSQIPPPSKVQRRGGEARVYIQWLALVKYSRHSEKMIQVS